MALFENIIITPMKESRKIGFVAFMLLCIIGFSITACSKKLSPAKMKHVDIPNLQVFVDGVFIKLESDEKPEYKLGEDAYYRTIFGGLRYPANARENSIQGTVIHELIIDALGNVESISLFHSLDPECDVEARKAVDRIAEIGFKPFLYNDQAVQVKYFMPLKFKLE